DVRIASVTPSCGCTTPQFSRDPFKSRESTYITISMDTNRFQGNKSSSITVNFDQPTFATVVIPVSVFIRTDVVFTPGAVNFGTVEQGSSQSKKLDVAYAYQIGYAGDPEWKILDVAIKHKSIKATFKERGRGDGRVDYDLVVNLLPDA